MNTDKNKFVKLSNRIHQAKDSNLEIESSKKLQNISHQDIKDSKESKLSVSDEIERFDIY